MEYKKHPERRLRHFISVPFIYLMIIPLIIFDMSLEIYHHICFRLYKIPIIKRKNYIRIDRHKLKYLSFFGKINCAYCGYANGLVNYAVKIAGDTEKYWCAIKHKDYQGFIPPKHQRNFLNYGDEKSFKRKYKRP